MEAKLKPALLCYLLAAGRPRSPTYLHLFLCHLTRRPQAHSQRCGHSPRSQPPLLASPALQGFQPHARSPANVDGTNPWRTRRELDACSTHLQFCKYEKELQDLEAFVSTADALGHLAGEKRGERVQKHNAFWKKFAPILHSQSF